MGEFCSRIPILGQISISGGVEYWGIPDFHRTGGPFWAVNILATRSIWGDCGTTTNQKWLIAPGGPYGIVALLWSCPVPVRLAYVTRSLENTRAAACRFRGDHL